ncbi:MAG: (Fe-S)-binding protein [Deltaproteobacteria bacterium]|nr:MAG: (Fe-S)-binding protein [Deltaproteobacteria bacterium]
MSIPCEFCPKLCHHACPVGDVTHDEALNTWGKINTLRSIDLKRLPETLENYSSAYQCVQCHSSETDCEINTPATDILIHYRQKAFSKGLVPPSIQKHMAEFEKIRLHIDRDKSAFNLSDDVLFIPSFDHNNTEDPTFEKRIKKIFKLFEKLNIKNVSLFESDRPCCGYPYYAAGDVKSFLKHAKHQVKFLKGFKTIVSDSPICLQTFQKYYSHEKIFFKFNFQHLSEFLRPFLKNSKKQDTVAYHDPCFLGRHRGVYEAPREILKKVSGEVLEFRQHHEKSYCCGGGGLYPVTSPKEADQMTLNRLNEYKQTGAEVLVTGCSTCTTRLHVVNKDLHLNLKIFDLVDYLLT